MGNVNIGMANGKEPRHVNIRMGSEEEWDMLILEWLV